MRAVVSCRWALDPHRSQVSACDQHCNACSEALRLVGGQVHVAAVGDYLRSSQVIGCSLKLQLEGEQRARSQAEAAALAAGAQAVSCAPYTLPLRI